MMKTSKKPSSNVTINLDLDGVLADFHKAAQALFPGQDYKAISPIKFWTPITKEIDNFFSTLDPLHDAHELYDFVKSIPQVDKVRVLTALPRPEGKAVTAGQDKTDWVHKHIDPKLEVITVIGGKNKYRFCDSEHDVLIDDMARNVGVWEDQGGGKGILHVNAKSTIEQLKRMFQL